MDRNALLCDFAEYYGVYSLTALSAQTTAILAGGLMDRAEARIVRRLTALEKADKETAAFNTPEEFMAARAKIMGGGNNNGL